MDRKDAAIVAGQLAAALIQVRPEALPQSRGQFPTQDAVVESACELYQKLYSRLVLVELENKSERTKDRKVTATIVGR